MSAADGAAWQDPAPGPYVVAESDPQRPALVTPDGRTVTFAELVRAANRVSNGLRGLGLAPGDAVATLLHNGSEHFELLLGIYQVAQYLVPVNVHLAPQEAAHIIVDCGAKVLVAHADLAAALAPVADRLPAHRFVVGGPVAGWADYRNFRGSHAAQAPRDRLVGAIMGYTSGTTGRPKGVRRQLFELSPEVMANFGTSFTARFGLCPGTGVHLVCSPLYHAAPANVSMQIQQLGHTLVIRDQFDAEGVLRDIERYRVTSTQMVPTHLHRIMRLPEPVRTRYDMSSLTTLLVAGSPFAPAAKEAVIAWLGPVVYEYLASTEGIVAVVDSAEALARPGTVGKPHDVKILDGEGNVLGPGEVGLIHFRLQIPFEYHNDAQKTAAAVSPDGYATVGDLGRLDEDGYLYLLDRRDDLIISGGVNIYPAEVEQRLILHPAVADVAVVGVPDEEWGQRVVAVVSPEPGWAGHAELATELDRFCREGLAALKRPRRYEFRATLPRSASGKLSRGRLREELTAAR
ncbi:MAG TPA: AMP-binding protein [Rugosimonospora sp.]|nr:AMP-binding protein [Rugosimonospora sp.]